MDDVTFGVGEHYTQVRGSVDRRDAIVVWRDYANEGVSKSRAGMGVGGSVVVAVSELDVSKRRRATCGVGPSLCVEVGSGDPNAGSFLPPWPRTLSAMHPLLRLSGGPIF
jgi:hypothetical protein